MSVGRAIRDFVRRKNGFESQFAQLHSGSVHALSKEHVL